MVIKLKNFTQEELNSIMDFIEENMKIYYAKITTHNITTDYNGEELELLMGEGREETDYDENGGTVCYWCKVCNENAAEIPLPISNNYYMGHNYYEEGEAKVLKHTMSHLEMDCTLSMCGIEVKMNRNRSKKLIEKREVIVAQYNYAIEAIDKEICKEKLIEK